MEELPIEPAFDKIVILPDPKLAHSTGGIHIPSAVQERTFFGTVVAVGNGKTDDTGKITPLSVGVGDRVIYAKSAGSTLKLGKTEYVLVVEDEIYGTIED